MRPLRDDRVSRVNDVCIDDARGPLTRSHQLQTSKRLRRMRSNGRGHGPGFLRSCRVDSLRPTVGSNNAVLNNLRGLDNVVAARELNVVFNPSLVALTGLERLRSVERLTLESNARLTSLRALSALEKTSAVSIIGNTRLPQCEIDRLATRAHFGPPESGVNGPPGVCDP